MAKKQVDTARPSQRRLRIGDILQIKTDLGFAYAQCTHKDTVHGYLIRVFQGIHKSRISDHSTLTSCDEAFSIFILWGSSVNPDIVSIVGHAEVSPRYADFPIFKAGIASPKTHKVETWWLWDGKTEWKVGDLTKAQQEYPIREIWNDVLLSQRIATGWRSTDIK